MNTKAHPNISGIISTGPKYDTAKWVAVLKEIYSSMRDGIEQEEAIKNCTAGWEPNEKVNFLNWMRYYESGTPEKYNVKNANLLKTALSAEASPLLEQWVNPANRTQFVPPSAIRTPQKTQRELEMDKAKKFKGQMKSRLQSLKRLVDRFNEVMPKSSLDAIYQELFNLDRNITRLEVYASMVDCTVRSANKLHKLGFSEGADFLNKIAQDPPAAPPAATAPMAPPSATEVIQALPAGTSDKPEAAGGMNVNLQTVINRLEGISKRLKSRATVRELASVDILLNEMGLASYFTEVTDAQAKLIEAYGYSSNRIEGVIAKLRGSGSAKPEPIPVTAPFPEPTAAPKKEKVNKDELMQAPAGQVQTKLPPVK
jgi:hypothetical protein